MVGSVTVRAAGVGGDERAVPEFEHVDFSVGEQIRCLGGVPPRCGGAGDQPATSDVARVLVARKRELHGVPGGFEDLAPLGV